MLRGAAAMARGQLAVLHLKGCEQLTTQAARLEVVEANAGSVRKLRFSLVSCENFLYPAHVIALARAAPQLEVFDVGVCATVRGATQLLLHRARYGALRVRGLRIYPANGAVTLVEAEDLAAFAEVVSTQLGCSQAVV